MDCNKIKDLLSEYRDGNLDVKTIDFIEKHLLSCESCSNEFKWLETYFQEINSLQKFKAPDDFLQKINERIKKSSGLKSVLKKLLIDFPITLPIKVIGFATTVVLIIFIIKGTQLERKAGKSLYITDDPVFLKMTDKLYKESTKKSIRTPTQNLASAPPAKQEQPSISLAKRKMDKIENYPAQTIPLVADKKEEQTIQLAFLIKDNRPDKRSEYRMSKQEMAEKKNMELEYDEFSEGNKALSTTLAGASFSATEKTTPVSTLLNDFILEIKKELEIAGGKLISIEHHKQTNLPEFVNAEIPITNYSSFLGKINRLAVLQKPQPLIKTGIDPIKLKIEILPGQ